MNKFKLFLLYSIFFFPIFVLSIDFVNGQNVTKEINDLSKVFDLGYILQDINDDSVVDFINTKILVPENASESQIACAANIAARLAYETSGIDLDLVNNLENVPSSYPKPIISISAFSNNISPNNHQKYSLAPGQGRIQFFKSDNYPQGVLSIRGADDTGLIAASNYFAGRYPNLWKLKGKTFSEAKQKFEKYFTQRELSYSELVFHSIDLDANKPGITKLFLEIRFEKKNDFKLAIKNLKNKDEKKNSDKDKELLNISDLFFQDVHKISILFSYSNSSKVINLISKKSWATKKSSNKSSAPNKNFSLWQLYSLRGLFQDQNKDFIPDGVPVSILLGGVKNANDITNFSARLGLESAGINLPIVRMAGEEDNPSKLGFPILFGQNHYLINQLKEENKIPGILDNQNTGFIQLIQKAEKDKNYLVVSAESQPGLNAISDYVSKRLPYLWEYGKGNFLLKDIEKDVQDFFQIKKAPGQVVLSLYKLKTWLGRLEDRKIDSISVELAAEKTPTEIKNFTQNIIRDYFKSAQIDVKTYPTGFGENELIFKEEFEIPWEVDDFWKSFRESVLPQVNFNSKGKIRVLVSESPEIRKKLEKQISEELNKNGVSKDAFEIVVLSAYKQGYSWLYDEVFPKIRKKKIGRIEITYHSLKDSKEIRWQTINASTRWLQEIYPIDAVFAKELYIPDTLITFHSTFHKNPIYIIRVFDKKGKEVFIDTYNPKYVVRPFFDLFPEYESVRVTTGWVTAEINNKIVLDQRIKTDPERFWDHFQTKTYRKIIDYVMDIQDGRPSSNNAPFFNEFRVNVTLSEPNYRLGIDEEVISSLEALHEDIYFETLTLFNLIGGRYGSGSMSFPGRILPYIQPSVDGKPGQIKIELTGKKKANPHIILKYREKDKEHVQKEYDLRNLNVPTPKLTGIWVEPDKEGISQLMFEIMATDSIDQYEKYKMRSLESAIDRTIISIDKLKELVTILGDLHKSGIFETELSYDKVENILFRVALQDSIQIAKFMNLPKSANPKNTSRPKLFASDFKYSGEKLVQWQTPIDPTEAAEVMAKLNTFSNINTYYVATSLLKQPVFVMDLYPHYKTKYISQAKLNALKPTLFISGRQHANEVSSTSHILRLAELIATDTIYTNYLKKVNLVLQPITNIDGAKLGMELHKKNPNFMLHAAYYGPLGVDVDSGRNYYPESLVRPTIRETWLPDVYLNPHGYPSHEWVQYFAGYSAWVRNRNSSQRTWWSPRGWFIPGFRWIEDKKYLEHKTVSFAILDSIAKAITSIQEMGALNNRMYKRYKKYGIQDRENFREYFHNGILVNASIKGRKLTDNKITGPKVTYFSLTTEAPDETASGDFLDLICQAGLAHTSAVLKYLATGQNRIKYEAKEYQDSVNRYVYRKRPVLPFKAKEEKKQNNK